MNFINSNYPFLWFHFIENAHKFHSVVIILAIKKRGRESITLPLPIRKKKYNTLNGVHTLKRDGTKKSKAKKVRNVSYIIISFTELGRMLIAKGSLILQMKGHITKDEEEVAETLNALAGMFADEKGAHHPGLDHEKTVTKSSAVLEKGDSINATEGLIYYYLHFLVTLECNWYTTNIVQ